MPSTHKRSRLHADPVGTCCASHIKIARRCPQGHTCNKSGSSSSMTDMLLSMLRRCQGVVKRQLLHFATNFPLPMYSLTYLASLFLLWITCLPRSHKRPVAAEQTKRSKVRELVWYPQERQTRCCLLASSIGTCVFLTKGSLWSISSLCLASSSLLPGHMDLESAQRCPHFHCPQQTLQVMSFLTPAPPYSCCSPPCLGCWHLRKI